MKNLMTCAILMALLTTTSALASLTDGLVAYYPFDGDANDASGNEYDLTLYGATPASDRCGNDESAYRFDGVDDYIEGSSCEIIVPSDQDSFAISFWFSPSTNWIEGVNPNSMLVGNIDPGGLLDWGVMIADWPGAELYFWWLDEDPGPPVELKTARNSWNAGTWYHVAYNYDASTSNLSAWINGTLENTTSMPDIGRNNGDIIRIGRYNFEYADMTFDELRLYDRALTKEECELLGKSFSVLAPDGGEELIAGQRATIEWTSSLAEDANVLLEYSVNSGADWNDVDVNPVANTGSYEWLVPETTSNQCLVRITDAANPNLTDTSDDVFTIYVCQLSGAAADADLDDNCKVDFTDFSIWSSQWLKNGNPFDTAYTEEMALIPAGEFQMGDSFEEGRADELPAHMVFFDTFMMARHGVTNHQYAEFLNDAFSDDLIEVKADNIVYKKATTYVYCATHDAVHDSRIAFTGSRFVVVSSDKANHPMVEVSWYGAAAYCNWQSRQEEHEECYDLSNWECDFSKNGYRLPTEAEWEYAARGGLFGKRFPWGDTINHDNANYSANGSAYVYDTSPYTSYTYHPVYAVGEKPYTAPVGSFSPNGYGLYDMVGNVFDWCNDWYQSDYYESGPYHNPTGPTSGISRVCRGGSWHDWTTLCRLAYRNSSDPALHFSTLGFRVVRRPGGGSEPETVAFHVDGTIGDDGNDGLSRATAFETIQKGIDTAADGNVVLVWPGVYVERISFDGKAITIKNADYPAVIESPWQDAVSFHFGEGAGSVLANFVIRGSMTAIACNNGSRPTLKNLTIVGNQFGIAAYENSQPDISNCILWGNRYGDLYQCEARYSCVEFGTTGVGSISVDPMFADLASGNYHLLSESGRYVPAYGLWSFDEVTSPCIDRGDPADDPADERMPNGNRINMGAYAGTAYASMGAWAA